MQYVKITESKVVSISCDMYPEGEPCQAMLDAGYTHVPMGTPVSLGWVYDEETGSFAEPTTSQ